MHKQKQVRSGSYFYTDLEGSIFFGAGIERPTGREGIQISVYSRRIDLRCAQARIAMKVVFII